MDTRPTCGHRPRVKRLIPDRYQVDFDQNYERQALEERSGFGRQRPHRIVGKRDEEKHVEWIRTTWTQLKKGSSKKDTLAFVDEGGPTRWHHHVSMVLVAYAFLSQLPARHDAADTFPSLRTVAMNVEWELATQALIEDHGLKRDVARRHAATLRRASDWFKPRK